MKKLTIKTLALIAVTTSDRGQTLSKLNIKNMRLDGDSVTFVITDRLKTTGKLLKPKVVNCAQCLDPALNVASHVREYIARTEELRRPEDSQLFISWATHRPVSSTSLARWLKLALISAGIDANTFGAHSYRGASLSDAYAKGVSIPQIMKAGDWTTSKTFFKHYNTPSTDTPVGQLILSLASESSAGTHVNLLIDISFPE